MTERQLTDFEKKLHRNRFVRALGHNPIAANCIFVREDEGDYVDRKQVCERCLNLSRKFRGVGWFQ